MDRTTTTAETDRTDDPVTRARHALASTGVCLLPGDEVLGWAGVDPSEWARFAAHWEDLSPDPYAAERGTRRLRRYGRFRLPASGAGPDPMPHRPFVQPQASNPLYVEVDRHFDPLTRAFASDPVLHALLGLLARAATALDDVGAWLAQVHPFRVVAPAGSKGEPTPEGMHHDGVTLVSSLLVARHNAAGGQSFVHDGEGRPLLEVTLGEPADLLLGDDRRTLHGVAPLHSLDGENPARRDVLVTTLVPAED
ncbi:2OG-Fe dioxygenase family protein [Streptomyces chromofuscus]|uniref:2OG-Fe dioxygenase family protein n=1 Tax=Streptomyces chromofuscus TaxID=42881 RepID=UPI0016741D64|nr:2OG-Fe dioxygenase family protein [Streptomyces chromofuscus]GGT15821.1 hypothetical protein GCM10010254_40500 [Streptomyces chromofuscus]